MTDTTQLYQALLRYVEKKKKLLKSQHDLTLEELSHLDDLIATFVLIDKATSEMDGLEPDPLQEMWRGPSAIGKRIDISEYLRNKDGMDTREPPN